MLLVPIVATSGSHGKIKKNKKESESDAGKEQQTRKQGTNHKNTSSSMGGPNTPPRAWRHSGGFSKQGACGGEGSPEFVKISPGFHMSCHQPGSPR